MVATPLAATDDSSRALMWAAVGLWIIAKGWLSWVRNFDIDEFESLHQGWLMFSGAVQYQDFNSNHPPLVFELLGLLNYLSSDPIVLLRAGRLLSFVLTSISLLLLYRIARLIYNTSAARWTVAVFAFNATLLEASTDVRTNMLMVPLWLAAIWILVGGGGLRPPIVNISTSLHLTSSSSRPGGTR